MTTVHRLLYATDLSPASEPAWNEVRRLGQLFGAEIVLLHVLAPPPIVPVDAYIPPQVYEPVPDRHLSAEALGRMGQVFHDQGRVEAERFLESSTLPRERVQVRLAQGVPGEQIVRRAQDADLVVMGTHGW